MAKDKIHITVVEGPEAEHLLREKAARDAAEREIMLKALAEAKKRGKAFDSLDEVSQFLSDILGEPVPPHLDPKDFPEAKEGETVLEGKIIFEMAGMSGLAMDCEGLITDDGRKIYDNDLFRQDSKGNDLYPGMRVRVIRSGNGFRVEKV